jgi:di/tricarboxylate transporter
MSAWITNTATTLLILPNAIAIGSGYVSIKQMVRYGWITI